MGQRAVEIRITMPLKDGRKVTENAWTAIEDVLADTVDQLTEHTILDDAAVVDARYLREVEVREQVTFVAEGE